MARGPSLMGAPAPRPGSPARNYMIQPRGHCTACGQRVWWGWTARQRRCPYDFAADGTPTKVSHFTTCANVQRLRKQRAR